MLLDSISIHSWIQTNQIKTESGKQLDFHTHRYLFDIYRDNSKFLCCLKAGQIGFSTMAILKTIWLARNKHLDIIYILPTVDMQQKFVGSKVNRMAQQNPIIEEWFADKDSISQKQIGENFIFYLGAQTDRSAIMITADLIISDEHDKSPQDILETYNSRLQHSLYGGKWVFSNPTVPDFGVDKFWAMSDQKKWHITHSCGKTYIMDEGCIDYTRKEYVCPHCQNVITSEEIRMGEWIATAKGEWSGYWIPLWINPMIEAKTICDYKKTSTKEYFYNFVAGLPYVNPTDALTQSILEANLSSDINSQKGRVIIGMDTGHNLHYTMMNKEGIFYHGYCQSIAEAENKGKDYDPYNEIEKRLLEYPNSILISDQGGDLIGIRKLQAKYPGRVYLCWFTKETREQELIRWGEGERLGNVYVDRNRTIQLAVDQLNEKRMIFNGTKEDWQPFFNHTLNIYRFREIKNDSDPQYGWRWVWKRKGADHWFLSLIYALVGMDKFSQDLAQVISKNNWKPQIGTTTTGDISGRRILKKMGLDIVDFSQY